MTSSGFCSAAADMKSSIMPWVLRWLQWCQHQSSMGEIRIPFIYSNISITSISFDITIQFCFHYGYLANSNPKNHTSLNGSRLDPRISRVNAIFCWDRKLAMRLTTTRKVRIAVLELHTLQAKWATFFLLLGWKQSNCTSQFRTLVHVALIVQ